MTRERVYASDWINQLENLDHWCSYWYQLKLMEGVVKKGNKVIEVGVGSGFLANYLRNKDIEVLTLDIDKGKKADVYIDIVDFQPQNEFDFFCAFEVFEHLEFTEIDTVLDNVVGHLRKGIFFSVPSFNKIGLYLELRIKYLVNFKKDFAISLPPKKISTKAHQWELGYKEYNEKRLSQKFIKRGMKLKKRFNYLHWNFFYFEKIE
jgi:2-polyprenyl-3-methyl-5-hydroxy-6-metoxy-1,4-benzoquinol methylase